MSHATPPGAAPPAFQPYVAPETRLREFTLRAILVGTLLGMVFGASSLYLVLKVGLTVSASIPVAVISITLFRLALEVGVRDATILENNIVQTAGSAGESIAFGVGVTMPAIMILGFDLELTRVMLVAVLGGAARHPDDDPAAARADRAAARRAQVSRGHRVRRGAQGRRVRRSRGRPPPPRRRPRRPAASAVASPRAPSSPGSAIGLVYKTAMVALKGWKDIPEKIFGAPFTAGSLSAEISPGAARRGLHHRAADRVHDVRGRRARLPRADPADQVLRRRRSPVRSRPAPCPISEMGPNAHPRRLRPLHRRRRGRGGRHHQPRCARCPRSGTASSAGLRDVAAHARHGATRTRTEHDLPMKVVFVRDRASLIARHPLCAARCT